MTHKAWLEKLVFGRFLLALNSCRFDKIIFRTSLCFIAGDSIVTTHLKKDEYYDKRD